jgi:hypothetical protein
MLESAGFDQVESRRLATVARADDAPELFTLIGQKPASNVGKRKDKQ